MAKQQKTSTQSIEGTKNMENLFLPKNWKMLQFEHNQIKGTINIFAANNYWVDVYWVLCATYIFFIDIFVGCRRLQHFCRVAFFRRLNAENRWHTIIVEEMAFYSWCKNDIRLRKMVSCPM